MRRLKNVRKVKVFPPPDGVTSEAILLDIVGMVPSGRARVKRNEPVSICPSSFESLCQITR